MGYDLNTMTKEEILLEVSNNGENLQFLNSQWRKDKEIILAAVKQNGLSLYYADYHQNDDEVVRAAIEQEPESIQFANFRLRNDRELAKTIIKADPNCMEFLSKDIQNDKELILIGLHHNFVVLEDIDYELSNDTDFMKQCCDIEIMSLKYCSDRLKNDWSFVKPLMIEQGSWLHFASDEIRDDRDYMYEYVTQSKLPNLKYISNRLKEEYGEELIDFIKNIEKDYNLDKNTEKVINDELPKYTEMFIKNTDMGKYLYQSYLTEEDDWFSEELNQRALKETIDCVSMKESFFSFHLADYVKEHLGEELEKNNISKQENTEENQLSEDEIERREIYKLLGLPFGSLSSESGNDWVRAKNIVLEEKKQKLFESMNNGEKPDYITIEKNNQLFSICLNSSSPKEQDNKIQLSKRNDLTNEEIEKLIDLGSKDVLINVCKEQKLTSELIDKTLNKHTYLSLKNLIRNQTLNDNQKEQINLLMDKSPNIYKDLKEELNTGNKYISMNEMLEDLHKEVSEYDKEVGKFRNTYLNKMYEEDMSNKRKNK